jgi:hypothetical protein
MDKAFSDELIGLTDIFNELGLIGHLYDFYNEDINFIDFIKNGLKLMTIGVDLRVVENPEYLHPDRGLVLHDSIICSYYLQYDYKSHSNHPCLLLNNFSTKIEKIISLNDTIDTNRSLTVNFAHFDDSLKKVILYHITSDSHVFFVDSFTPRKKLIWQYYHAEMYGDKVYLDDDYGIHVYTKISGNWVQERSHRMGCGRHTHLPGTDFFHNGALAKNIADKTVIEGYACSLINGGFVIANYQSGSDDTIVKIQGSTITHYPATKGRLIRSLNPNYIVLKYSNAYEVLDTDMNILRLVYI